MCPRGQLRWILSLCEQPGPVLPHHRGFLTLSESAGTPRCAGHATSRSRSPQAGRLPGAGGGRSSAGQGAAVQPSESARRAWSALGELPEHIFRCSSALGGDPVGQLPTSTEVRGGGREGDLEQRQKAEAGTHMLHGKGRDRSFPQGWGHTQRAWGASGRLPEAQEVL